MHRGERSQDDGSMERRARRRRAFFKGHWAEYIASIYLTAKGYRVCARRFKTRFGEVDIIAKKGDVLAIVEVKARNSIDEAVNAVGWQSQKRIANAADFWLSKQLDWQKYSIRFDIIAIMPWSLPVHLEDAF